MKEHCLICGSESHTLSVQGMLLRRCNACNLLWIVRPDLPDDHYILKGDDPGKYDRRIRNTKDRARELSKIVDLNNLCDIGAGDGTFLEVLSDAGFQNLIGIDPNKESVLLARARGVNVLQEDLNSLEVVLKENKSTTVSLFHVIEHLDNPKEVLNKIYEALPKKGILILETPNVDAYLIKKSGYNHDLVYPEHRVLFNDRNLKELLDSSGFEVKRSYQRDFDVEGVGIRDLLIRLGLLPYENTKTRISVSESNNEVKEIKSPGGFIRTFFRNVLVKLCYLLKRFDYVVIVAEKR